MCHNQLLLPQQYITMSAFSFTAPLFGTQDDARERSTLTTEELQRIEDQCFGRNSTFLHETPALVEASLREMAFHLAAIEHKPDFEEALSLVPHLVEQESPSIRFLRCENFCPEKAAQRLVKYWETRMILFEDKAFLPMRLDGALRDDIETMRAVPDLHFITGKDEHGRLILFTNKARLDFARYSRLSVNRVIWYHVHIHMEDIETQRLGMVGVGLCRVNSPKQFDRRQTKMFYVLVLDALPIKYKCAHICHPPAFFNIVLFPVIKHIMGKDLRLHTKTHDGSEEKVLVELEKYGIKRQKIFRCMGGTYDLHIDEWLDERRRVEGATHTAEG